VFFFASLASHLLKCQLWLHHAHSSTKGTSYAVVVWSLLLAQHTSCSTLKAVSGFSQLQAASTPGHRLPMPDALLTEAFPEDVERNSAE
jgi:hypothetical protein